MPYIDGEYNEPNNKDRAEFAREALDAYIARTNTSFDCAFRDLICDLHHLHDASHETLREDFGEEEPDFDHEIEMGLSSYHEEKLEEEGDGLIESAGPITTDKIVEAGS